MFPIPGTKRLKYLEENAAAYFVELTPEDKRFLEDTFHEDKVNVAPKQLWTFLTEMCNQFARHHQHS